MSQSIYFTNNLAIEVLLNNTVRLTNNREDGRVYLLDATRFYQLLNNGGKKWKIPTSDGMYVELTFNLERRHVSSAGGGINTYIAQHDYEMLLSDLETSVKIDLHKLLHKVEQYEIL